MATTFYVAGVDLGRSGLQTWSEDGGSVRINGTIRESTAAGFSVALAQINGILNNVDEASGVPVVPSADSSLAGFFRVTGGGVDVTPESYRSYWANYTLELEAVSGRYSPLIESRLVGALRTNSHSIVVGSTVPWWATPDDATMDFLGLGSGGAAATTASRVSDTGTLSVQYTTAGTLFLNGSFSFACSPADYYDGAAAVEVYDGTSWRKLVGREIGSATAASATGWRINNGLVRVTYGGAAGTFTVQHYVGGSWITAKTYRIFTTAGATVGSAVSGATTTATVLRNSPECVTIRIGMEYTTTYRSPIYLDLTLRRGAMWVDGGVVVAQGFVDLLVSLSLYIGIGRDAAEAATAHTSGLHATAADAAGGKYVLSTSVAKGNDTTQGAFWATTQAKVFPFMVGYEPSGAAGPDTYTNQYLAWFAATDETQRLARR